MLCFSIRHVVGRDVCDACRLLRAACRLLHQLHQLAYRQRHLWLVLELYIVCKKPTLVTHKSTGFCHQPLTRSYT